MQRAFIILFIGLNSMFSFSQTSKLDLLCQNWKQIGYKSHNDTVLKPVQDDCSQKICHFGKDGTYSEEMFSIKGIGYWQFNEDSSKFDYNFIEYMGQKIAEKKPIEHFNKLIIKLTKDTLIYGAEAYYGNDGVYGHDDWYFIKHE